MSSNIRVLLEHILPTNKLKAGRYINTNDPKESKNWFFTVGTNTDLELGKYDLQVLSDEMTRGMKHKTEYVRDACNFSRLVMCPARFTLRDGKIIF
jgi:hypothetical protein